MPLGSSIFPPYLRAWSWVSLRNADENQSVWVGRGCWELFLEGWAHRPSRYLTCPYKSFPVVCSLWAISESLKTGFRGWSTKRVSQRNKTKFKGETKKTHHLMVEYLSCGQKLKPGIFRKDQQYSDLPLNSAKARHQAWLTVKSNRIFQLK